MYFTWPTFLPHLSSPHCEFIGHSAWQTVMGRDEDVPQLGLRVPVSWPELCADWQSDSCSSAPWPRALRGNHLSDIKGDMVYQSPTTWLTLLLCYYSLSTSLSVEKKNYLGCQLKKTKPKQQQTHTEKQHNKVQDYYTFCTCKKHPPKWSFYPTT